MKGASGRIEEPSTPSSRRETGPRARTAGPRRLVYEHIMELEEEKKARLSRKILNRQGAKDAKGTNFLIEGAEVLCALCVFGGENLFLNMPFLRWRVQ